MLWIKSGGRRRNKYTGEAGYLIPLPDAAENSIDGQDCEVTGSNKSKDQVQLEVMNGSSRHGWREMEGDSRSGT